MRSQKTTIKTSYIHMNPFDRYLMNLDEVDGEVTELQEEQIPGP